MTLTQQTYDALYKRKAVKMTYERTSIELDKHGTGCMTYLSECASHYLVEYYKNFKLINSMRCYFSKKDRAFCA